MGLLDIFRRKTCDSAKNLTLEDCVVKMFESAGIAPDRKGNMFHTEVQGKHCAFDVALARGDGNKLIAYVQFPLPVDKNVAYAANYEVKRICKDEAEKFSGTTLQLIEKDNGYDIVAITLKPFGKLSDNTPDEIRKAMIQTVDILDDENFASLAAAIFGYKSYEVVKQNMKAVTADGNKVSLHLNDGYRELLGKTPGLNNSRYLGRLMAYATHIMTEKDDDELVNRAAVALSKSFDEFIQEIYNIAHEKERDLIRKLRFLGKANNEEGNDNDFVLGRNEAKSYLDAFEDPWRLVYGENLDNPDVPGRINKKILNLL